MVYVYMHIYFFMYYTTTVLHLPFNLQFPTQHSTFLTTSSILLHMQWNLLYSQRHLLLKRPHSIKKPFLYNSKPSDFPFLTKDQYLFIGCASETTPFSQRFYFLFFEKGQTQVSAMLQKTPLQTFASKDVLILFMSLF